MPGADGQRIERAIRRPGLPGRPGAVKNPLRICRSLGLQDFRSRFVRICRNLNLAPNVNLYEFVHLDLYECICLDLQELLPETPYEFRNLA